MRGEMEPGEAAAEYERTLRAFLTPALEETNSVDDVPVSRFDLILLGMGEDGHTASLFPRSSALGERKRMAVATYVDNLQSWRVTLTPLLINAAAQVTFIVSGEHKAEALRQVLSGPHQPDLLPAQAVRPRSGSLLWMVDAAAAALL
jgi:6-phosphogluconolactonase